MIDREPDHDLVREVIDARLARAAERRRATAWDDPPDDDDVAGDAAP